MGNPVAHSKSPQIHTAFASQTGQKMFYQAILVEPGGFPAALEKFRRQGGKGLNITLPFKQEAWAASRIRSRRADRARAVNTIWFTSDDGCHGDNTDGIGLVRDLTGNHAVRITGQAVLILGAGGAVHGILDPLFDEKALRVVIANRTLSRAEQLADLFSDRGEVSACSFADLAGEQFHLVINGTSASLQGEIPPLPEHILAGNACCYDMMYAQTDTAFVTWAKEHGAALALDGIGMLVEQAAESFLLWRGVRPDTGPVIRMLKTE